VSPDYLIDSEDAVGEPSALRPRRSEMRTDLGFLLVGVMLVVAACATGSQYSAHLRPST
jgi:hypothetical protein